MDRSWRFYPSLDVQVGISRVSNGEGGDFHADEFVETRWAVFKFQLNKQSLIQLLTTVIEGVYLHSRSQSPYEGDVFHETPIALEFYSFLASLPLFILRASFIVTDILTALVMARAAGIFYKSMVNILLVHQNVYSILLIF